MTAPFSLLVVEDDPADAYLIDRALKASGAPVAARVASRAEDALTWLDEDRFDLVLSDLKLPGMSGADLVEAVRTERAHRATPIVVFSSSSDPDDIRTAYSAGANAYVRKPGDLAGYETVIDRLIGFWADLNLTAR